MKQFYLIVMLFFAMASGATAQTFDQLYQKASAGDAQAQYELGVCYNNGNGVEKNYLEAMNWFIKAAKNNQLDAAVVYGSNLLKGQPSLHVAKNVAEGVKYLRKAADQKNQDAIMILVGDYINALYNNKNLGTKKYISYNDFVKYLKLGAELGNEDLQTIVRNLPQMNLVIEQEKNLVAKYGQKAFDSIKQGKVYVGMPEGILTAYRTIEDDGSRFQMYNYNGPYRDKVGSYKQYIPNSVLQMANMVGQVFPRIVKVRNGKVTNVIY